MEFPEEKGAGEEKRRRNDGQKLQHKLKANQMAKHGAIGKVSR